MFPEILSQGYQWGYAFLSCKGGLPECERERILCEAIEMCCLNLEKRVVETDTYEGVIFSAHRYEVLGGLSGHRYDAKIETNDGKVELSFLICDQTGREVGVHSN